MASILEAFEAANAARCTGDDDCPRCEALIYRADLAAKERDALKEALGALLLRLHASHSTNSRVETCDYVACIEERARVAALASLDTLKGAP